MKRVVYSLAGSGSILSCLIAFVVLIGGQASPVVAAQSGTDYQGRYEDVWRFLKERYLYGVPADWDSLKTKYGSGINSPKELREAVAKLLSHLKGSGAKLLSPEEAEALEAHLASGYIGIGASFDAEALISEVLTIKEVETDSTAEAAGLKAGDLIVSVNGKGLRGYTLEEASDLIKGPEGTFVELGIRRGATLQATKVERDLDERLGVTLEIESPEWMFRVDWLCREAPAEKSGVQEDDILIAVDGRSVDGISQDELSGWLKHGRLKTQVELTLLRQHQRVVVTVARDIVKSWDLSAGFQWQSGGGTSAYYNRSRLTLKNLDWVEVHEWIDPWVKEMEELPGGILDLRGAKGNDPVVAALVAARFLAEDVVLFQVHERHPGHLGVTTTYEIQNGVVVRTFSNGSAQELGTVKSRYSNKLVVLVDDHTAGTAEALAHALQHTGRATVVGAKKSRGDSIVTTHIRTDAGGEPLTVVLEAGQLLTHDGKELGAVTPDRYVWILGSTSVLDEAYAELAGHPWYYQPGKVLVVLILGGLGTWFAVSLLRRAFRRARRDRTGLSN